MSNRKVHFSVPIHQIEYLDKQWDEVASQLARDGSTWLRMSADRHRFTDRIERTAEILNRILDIEFRKRVYKERFESLIEPEQSIDTKTDQSTDIASNITVALQNLGISGPKSSSTKLPQKSAPKSISNWYRTYKLEKRKKRRRRSKKKRR